jgi:arylsulfatase A-like enzyme
MSNRPNIVYFHVDNLGCGELSCYSGGPFRGTWTKRTDDFAREGFRLTNYAPESQCTPSRAALLTGRYAIRTGCQSVPIGTSDEGWGLVAWEKTLGDLLSEAGYVCAIYGKWHVGEGDGHWPTDKGFSEWYGPERTYDEALWPTDPWYDPARDPSSYMLEATVETPGVTKKAQLTLEERRDCDREYLDRAGSFIRSAVDAEDPFFVYFNHSMMHLPVIPRKEFTGVTGHGDWADSLLELDSDFGEILDLLDELDLAEDTLVVFAGDNGPEEIVTWRGSPGFWEGSYFAGGEGNLRTPCIVRWPGRVVADSVSDDIMHITDWFATILAAAGVAVPDDREIDGINQLEWLTGAAKESLREGYPYWMGSQLYGAKWRNFKLELIDQQYSTDAVLQLSFPKIINLITDPQEREAYNAQYLHSWTLTHFMRILGAFRQSIGREPLVPVGSPLDHVPVRTLDTATP